MRRRLKSCTFASCVRFLIGQRGRGFVEVPSKIKTVKLQHKLQHKLPHMLSVEQEEALFKRIAHLSPSTVLPSDAVLGCI